MSVTRNAELDGDRPFEMLGISQAEERVYRWLLTHTEATASEAAFGVGWSRAKTQRLLDVLDDKGLATHTPERPRRYIAAPPDTALKTIYLRRQERLQKADAAIKGLQEEIANQPEGKKLPTVEMISSRESVTNILEQLYRSSRHEILALSRPPLFVSRPDEETARDDDPLLETLARNVRVRCIVDSGLLELPGVVSGMQAYAKAGEVVRVTSSLPFKMVLSDHRLGIIPLNLERADSPSLLVRSSALLDALYALFFNLWEQAAAVSFSSTGELDTEDADPDMARLVEEMVSLMAAGLNDKSIAAELDMSMRTFRRRSVDMMSQLKARTRFQAGWLANQRLHDRPRK